MVDANHNGEVSPGEFIAGIIHYCISVRYEPSAGEWDEAVKGFMYCDTNDDGNLSLKEV